MNLPVRLAEIARTFPEQQAIVYRDHIITYQQLDELVNQLANGMRKLGVSPGHRILVALGNSPEFVISYYAIMRLGAIIVPVNPQYTANELGVIMRDALPAAVICEPLAAPVFSKLAQEITINHGIIVTRSNPVGPKMHSFKRILEGSTDRFFSPASFHRDDVAEILYTAGNTGTPKGAMLTHHNLYSNALTFAQICRMTERDRALLIAPAYHSAAQTCIMNNTLISGATLVIHDQWAGPQPLLETVEEERITIYFGPPTMYALLVDYEPPRAYDTSSWRIAFTGAASLPTEVFYKFANKFGFEITEGYGLTETSPVVTTNPVFGLKKPGSIGLPIPGVEVKIVDYEDREVPVGQVGEIIVRGPNVMAGYYNREEETRWALRNGWFHTGDLAYMDQDGYLFIVDRKKDLIIRGGLNIHPREVEEVLYTHPAIFEAAVVGVPDPIMGEEVLAFVLTRDGRRLDEEELRRFCAEKLARYKIPRYFRFVENLPKTTSGKLLKGELRKMAD
ncbi:MAG: class I adenylate-forming enzyme family protein [Bacillota bacterium]